MLVHQPTGGTKHKSFKFKKLMKADLDLDLNKKSVLDTL